MPVSRGGALNKFILLVLSINVIAICKVLLSIETAQATIDATSEAAISLAAVTSTTSVQTTTEALTIPSKNLLVSAERNGSILGNDTHKSAPRVTLQYQPLPPRKRLKHPYLGAQDSHGNYGYRHNATRLRMKSQNHTAWLTQDPTSVNCSQRDNDYLALQRIRLSRPKEHQPSSSLFCGVYSTSVRIENIKSIQATWGPECEGFMVASNVTDTMLDMVNIPHRGPEIYKNMWFKVQSMLVYIYDNYFDDFDWFHIGGDDMMVLVPNLKSYLDSDDIRRAADLAIDENGTLTELPLLLGCLFAKNGDMYISNEGRGGKANILKFEYLMKVAINCRNIRINE